MTKHDTPRPRQNGDNKTRSIDGDVARQFLGLLDPDHDQFLFAAGADNKAAKAGKVVWIDHKHGSIDAQLTWLNQQQARGFGIFTTVQRMKGKRRLAKNVDVIRALFHEWDTAAPPPTFELLPSLVVETSVSVDANGEIFPKLHSYWFTDPERPIRPEDFRGMMECMVETHGSDPAAKDLARVLRLPGSWHQKGDPHQVRIVGGSGARYGRDELLAAFPPPVRRKAEPKAPRPNEHLPGLERFSAPLKAIPADTYGIAIKVGQALHHESGGGTQGLQQWEAWCGISKKYAEGWCAEKWRTFNGHGITGGTIFDLAKEGGYVKPAPEASSGRPNGHAKTAKGNGAAATPAQPQEPKPDYEKPPPPSRQPGSNHPLVANEDAIASAFADRHADELRYCHDWGAWLRWDGGRWVRERQRLAFHYARQLAREANIQEKAAPAKASTAAGVERFAQADPRLATISETWDRDAWLLATPEGTIDLRTGEMRAAEPEDFITKRAAITPAPPGTSTPIWDAFLAQATGNDPKLISYLQRMTGYCLTGDVSEHALFFIHGDGGNGKGLFINTLTRILGDCATVASMDTFTASKGDRHPTDVAMLRGARLVSAQETEEGRAWSEVRIKALTGGDPITARFMRQDFFTFEPTFKLVIAGNHKPNLRSVDPAMRRRINIIPFTHKPKKPDTRLAEKLKAEWPGILRWCIDGCLAWQQQGLDPPSIVCNATDAYFDEQDVFARWLDEYCEVGPDKSETHAALFRSWKTWADSNGEHPGSSKDFTSRLLKANPDLVSVKNTPGAHGKRGFKGVRLKPANTSTQWQNQHDR